MPKQYYDTSYFEKFKKNTFLHTHLIGPVDRKEPVFSFLKKKYPKKTTLLDIGCGNGNFLHHAQSYFHVTGTDISKEALRWAKKQAPKATLHQASAYDLHRFKKNSFSIITAFDVFEHLWDIDKAAKEVFRLLKPDGVFCMSAPNGACLGKSRKWLQWYGFRDPSHLWYFSASEWNIRMQQNGFVPMKTWYNGLIDPPYLTHVPTVLQTLCIKYPTQGLSLLGFPLPENWGEAFFTIFIKNPGWHSTYHRDQLISLKKNR